MHTPRAALFLLLAGLLAPAAPAQCDLAAIFQDHMVVQRDLPVGVFGTAAPGSVVTAHLATSSASVTADPDGRFLVTLPAQPAGGPHELRVENQAEVTVLRDVLVGEVWLCSGQSNMEWRMRAFEDCDDDVERASDDQLRLLTVGRRASPEPQRGFEGEWQPATPETVRAFSATAYFFGRELRERLGVAVGLVSSSWGGTPAESWTRDGVMRHEPVLRPIVEHWDTLDARWPAAKQRYDAARADWEDANAKARAAGEDPPPAPRMPPGPRHRCHPSALWNGMIAPLVPMTFRGVIWYQGESNSTRGWQYATLFPAMIRDWRRAFGQGDLPFGFVQLASFDHPDYPPEAWAELREAQVHALDTVPNTGMAVAIDLGEQHKVHPQRKDEVGRRLALWALGAVLGEPEVTWSGPRYRYCRIEDDAVRCTFEHSSGLTFEGGEARGFTVAGEDRRFVPAEARIDGDSVVVWSSEVPAPRAVRYAWADWPETALRNDAGLPASPFRTDDWPLESTGRTLP